MSNGERTFLDKEQILNQRIVGIWQRFGSIGMGDWLDTADTWLELETGVFIRVPMSGTGHVEAYSLPLDAQKIEPSPKKGRLLALFEAVLNLVNLAPTSGKDMDEIVGATIVGIVSELFEGKPDDETSALILLEDGRGLTETMVAPHGTGSAGLFILSPDQIAERRDDPGLCSFFEDD